MIRIVNESLEDEYIMRIMSTVFKDDDPKYYDSTVKYLRSLSFKDLEDIIKDYNLYGIKFK